MRFKLQLILEMDEPEKNDVTLDIATFEKDFTRPEHIGLSINEAKNILRNLQKNVVEEQINNSLQSHSHCSQCQALLRTKDNKRIKYRTLYGTLDVKNPRYYLCKCQGSTRQSVTPLCQIC